MDRPALPRSRGSRIRVRCERGRDVRMQVAGSRGVGIWARQVVDCDGANAGPARAQTRSQMDAEKSGGIARAADLQHRRLHQSASHVT
jgi:hypothetical protein